MAEQLGQFTLRTNRYTVLGNGMHRRAANGDWVECLPVVQSHAGAIVCTGNSYRVILSLNLNAPGAVDLETSDGERLVLNPAGIGFFDPDTGRSVLLARMKDSQAEIVSSNKVVYRDAFEGGGIEASVVYTYDAGRFHQDVTFTRQPAFAPSDVGMSDRARLEVFSEFVQAPALERKARVLKRETDPALRAGMVEPDLVDETLVLSREMRMTLGKAFLNGDPRTPGSPGVPIAKRLVNAGDNRRVLVEAVEWRDVRASLNQLPEPVGGQTNTLPQASLTRQWPERRVAWQPAMSFETRLSQLTRSSPATLLAQNQRTVPEGFVLDYVLVECSSYMQFTGGTYLVRNEVDVTGQTQFSGLVILKFEADPNTPALYVYDCADLGSASLVLTSVNDDSIGEILPQSTGIPSANHADWGSLWFILDEPLYYDFSDCDFRYMVTGIGLLGNPSQLQVGNCYIRNCEVGFSLAGASGASLAANHLYVCGTGQTIATGENNSVTVYEGIDPADCDGDYDNDGLPDGWEMRNFGNPNQTAAGDPDGDDLSNLVECQVGTNPTSPDTGDTDSDNLPDNWEYLHFGNLGQSEDDDYDNDGRSNMVEHIEGTDPAVPNVPSPPASPKLAYNYWRKCESAGVMCGDPNDYSASDEYKVWIWGDPSSVPRRYGERHYVRNDCGGQWFDWEYWWDPATSEGDFSEAGCSCALGCYNDTGPFWLVPWEYADFPGYEKCNVTHFFPNECGGYNYTREADTRVWLYPSSAPRTVILGAAAAEMAWSENAGTWVPGATIDGSRISMAGRSADCNGEIPIRLTDVSPMDITPTVQNAPPWYTFDVGCRPARYYEFTRAYHPDAVAVPSLEELQGTYDSITSTLMTDQDQCLRDADLPSDPEARAQVVDQDSVPVYVDFKVREWATCPWFPSNWRGNDFTEVRFKIVESDVDLMILLTEGDFAVLKQVTLLSQFTRAASLQGMASTVIRTLDIGPQTHAHEWGHTQGLPAVYGSNFNRLMYEWACEGWKVNRNERPYLGP